MKPSEFEKIASEGSIIKFAEGIRSQLASVVNPIFAKFAEEVKKEEEKSEGPSKEELEAAAAEAAMGTPTTQNVDKPADLQGKTDQGMASNQMAIDKKELEGAITEAILGNDMAGLGKIISSLKESLGDEMASNAISIARQVMQDLLVSGQMSKEDMAGLSQAFAAAEE